MTECDVCTETAEFTVTDHGPYTRYTCTRHMATTVAEALRDGADDWVLVSSC